MELFRTRGGETLAYPCAGCKRAWVVRGKPTKLCESCTSKKNASTLDRLRRRPEGNAWHFVSRGRRYSNGERTCTLNKRTKRLHWDDTGEVVEL